MLLIISALKQGIKTENFFYSGNSFHEVKFGGYQSKVHLTQTSREDCSKDIPMTSSKDEITASKNPNDHGQRQNWDFDISEKVFLAAKCPPLRRAGDAKQLVINLFRWVRMQRLYLRWWSRKTSTLYSRLFRFLVLSQIWDWIWMKNTLVSARHK